jgi:hypothetical protein
VIAAGSPSFTLFNAGLYDYQSLRDLPWDAYRQFVLQLFQCRPQEETLAGVRFDGFIGDHRVLVYDFKSHPEATVGAAYVSDIAGVVGERLGTRCFIIAPAVTVEPYEDYIDVAGTRFYFLRIPYSIIAELHKRAFTELRQPSSEDLLNATIESVGFDFVTPPLVEATYTADEETFAIRIDRFESEAFAAGASEENIEDLAMVMVDCNYDGEVFDLDLVLFAEDLAQSEWTISIPREASGDRLMVIYLDLYGNEHREVKAPADFAPIKRPKKSASKAKRTASVKKTTRRKTPTKRRVVRKTTAKKTTAKKTTARKTTAKKTTAKKTTAKKTTAKKTTAKKTTAKKTTARKTTARKATPGKTTRKATVGKTARKRAAAKKTARSSAKKTTKRSLPQATAKRSKK